MKSVNNGIMSLSQNFYTRDRRYTVQLILLAKSETCVLLMKKKQIIFTIKSVTKEHMQNGIPS